MKSNNNVNNKSYFIRNYDKLLIRNQNQIYFNRKTKNKQYYNNNNNAEQRIN